MPDPARLPTSVMPPEDDAITDYDRLHFTQYLQLLDAEAMGLAWTEAAARILMLDMPQLGDALPLRQHDWCEASRTPDARLDKSWSEMVLPGAEEDDAPAPRREAPRRKRVSGREAPLSDLPLFADLGTARHSAPRPTRSRPKNPTMPTRT
jgi:hypothetical protein